MRHRRLVLAALALLAACDDGVAPVPVPVDPEGVGRIALVSQRDRFTWRRRGSFLAIMHADGSDHRIQPVPGGVRRPAWSPDGRSIAYARIAFDDTTGSGLYIYDVEGRTTRLVKQSLTLVDGPMWSPDGSRLAYTEYTRGDSIFSIARDGSDERLLARGYRPAWGPGDRLAYIAADTVDGTASPGSAVFVRSLRDGSVVRASPPGSGTYITSAWSRDGRLAAYRQRELAPARWGRDIVELTPGGAGAARVIATDSVTFGNPRLSWSPDGRHLVHDRWACCASALWIVRADGSRRWQVTPTMRSQTRVYGNQDASWAP